MQTCDFYLLIFLPVLLSSAQTEELLSEPILRVHPSPSVWIGHSVTLRCRSMIRLPGTLLEYRFFKGKEDISQEISQNELKIQSVQMENEGSYWCNVAANGVKEKRSKQVKVTVNEKLKVTLMLIIEGTLVYSEDSVTLECRIEDDLTDWIYRWYKGSERNVGNQIKGVNGHTYTIKSVTQGESGVYHCEAYGSSPPHYSKFSNPVELTVQERTVRLDVISSHTDGRIFEGDQVSLQCHVNGNTVGWKYELHMKLYGIQSLYKTKNEGIFTINPVTLRHRTFYWCQAGKGRLHMHSSDIIKLEVSELFSEPHLTVHPGPLVGYGHNVTLRCQSMIEFPEKQLVYQFYKETASISPETSQNQFTIQSFQMENTGSYWCDVAVKGTEKKRSNQVQVAVSVDYTTENAICLGLSGLVLLVLLVLVSDCFWIRVLSVGVRK